MNNYLVKVKEFMTTFGQPVLDKPTPLPEDRQKLRIALIFEELKEYAEASGKLDYFHDLCEKSVIEFTESGAYYSTEINQVEQFDALEDMQYVLSGAVHEHGFGEIFDPGFDEVHSSNMSKADIDMIDAGVTQLNYNDKQIDTYYKEKNGKFLTYRSEDNKVLKSHKYKSAQLAQFLKSKEDTRVKVYLTFRGIDDFYRAIFQDKHSKSYYGDCNSTKTGKPEDVIVFYKENIHLLEYFGESFNCEPEGGIYPNINLIIEE